MSQENVERYLRTIDAWNREDLDGMLAEVGPKFEMRTTGEFIGVEPAYLGRDGAERLWRDMKQPFERMWIDVRRVEDLGNRVLGLVTLRGVGKESGVAVEIERAHLTWFDGQEIGVLQNYSTWAEALEAAGLSE